MDLTELEELLGGKITSLPERIPGTDTDELHLFVSLFPKESLSKAFHQVAEYSRPGVCLPDAGMILEPCLLHTPDETQFFAIVVNTRDPDVWIIFGRRPRRMVALAPLSSGASCWSSQTDFSFQSRFAKRSLKPRGRGPAVHSSLSRLAVRNLLAADS